MLDLRLAVDESAYGPMPVKIRCLNPNHNDPAASLAVYPDNLHCFGCGWHRNDWDEALALLLGVGVQEARNVAYRYDTDSLDAYREKAAQQARREPLPTARARLYNRFLWSERPERAEWFFQRGLTRETIDELLLGHDGFRFTIPVFDKDDNLLTIRYRKDDVYLPDEEELPDGSIKRNAKYVGMPGRNGLYLYGERWLEGSKHAVICEGELDAARLRQCHVPACSATNGARQSHKIPHMLHELFPSIRTLYVATDADEPGEEAAIRTLQEAEGLGLEAYRLYWILGKDITEYLQNGGRLSDMVKGKLNGSRIEIVTG